MNKDVHRLPIPIGTAVYRTSINHGPRGPLCYIYGYTIDSGPLMAVVGNKKNGIASSTVDPATLVAVGDSLVGVNVELTIVAPEVYFNLGPGETLSGLSISDVMQQIRDADRELNLLDGAVRARLSYINDEERPSWDTNDEWPDNE